MIFPDKTLATRFEKRLVQDMSAYAETTRQLFPENNATSLAIGGGIAVYTGLNINSAIGIGINTPLSHTEIETLEAFFTARNLPTEIELCPFVDNSLLALLKERQYHLGSFVTAYVHPLSNLQISVNHEIDVAPVDDSASKIWVETVMDIQPDNPAPDTRLAQVAFKRTHVVCFLATIAGQPAGASALSIKDGVAILHFTATRKAYRNRGIQTAMIQARLNYAKTQGCELAFATTIPGNNSMRNLMRAGFQVAYTRFIMQKI